MPSTVGSRVAPAARTSAVAWAMRWTAAARSGLLRRAASTTRTSSGLPKARHQSEGTGAGAGTGAATMRQAEGAGARGGRASGTMLQAATVSSSVADANIR